MGARGLFALLLVPLLLAGSVARAHDKEVEGGDQGGAEPEAAALCTAGAAQGFPCWNVDLLAWLPLATFQRGLGNDVWGWTDPQSGREYALMGLSGGTAFVDVSDPEAPVYLGVLPTQTTLSTWRDVKTYADHAFVVSEARGHGLQVFDLRALAGVVAPPVLFEPTAHYAGFGNSHNIAVDEETGTAFAVGTFTCAGGLHLVDVTRPGEPVFAGCFADDGYTHDAHCVVYRGPDAEHRNREICFASNEDTVTIVDVTSRDAPRMLSRTGYEGSAYTHQGWLSEDQRHFLVDDELDEQRYGHNTRTYVWDVSDLDAPFVVGHYTGSRFTIDHNLYVVGNHVFEANYKSGLRVLRMGDLSRAELAEVAFFDTYPGEDGLGFSGAWSVYPFFASGIVVVSDINRGLFVLRPDLAAVPECGDGLDNDADGLTDLTDPRCAGPDGAAEAPRSDVAIDIEPRSAHNVLPSAGRGNVRVAVLGSERFDVGAIDPASLRFGPGEVPPRRRGTRSRDVDGDGRQDLVALYPLRRAALPAGAERACLAWESFDGVAYEGCDAVRMPPCGPDRAPGATAGRGPHAR